MAIGFEAWDDPDKIKDEMMTGTGKGMSAHPSLKSAALKTNG